MKKLLFAIIIIATIACKKEANKINPIDPDPTDTTASGKDYAKRLAFLQSKSGVMYSYNDTLGLSDSILIYRTDDSLLLNIYSSELKANFTMQLDSITPDSIAFFTVLPFNFDKVNYDVSDSITNCSVTNALSTMYPNFITLTYVFDGLYHSTISPDMDSTFVSGYAISREYRK